MTSDATAEREFRVDGSGETPQAKIEVNIREGAAAGALKKTGSGTLVLSGANTYTGSTAVSGGTLELGGGTATARNPPVLGRRILTRPTNRVRLPGGGRPRAEKNIPPS